MKNKNNMQKVYKKRRITLFIILVAILLILAIALIQRNNIQKIALGQNALSINVGGKNIDISKVISNEPNAPVVGAGMIPIKWNSSVGLWEITSVSDKSWYNYENGLWANVMLSDGVYQSELRVDMTNKKLAEKNIGAQIQESELGTIFTWIPRLAYTDTQVEFLKGTSILEYMWTTENCFNLEKYGVNSLDLAFTGIWVGQKEFTDATTLENKNTNMQQEDNIEGLIKNAQVSSITDSEKIAVEKLKDKYAVTLNNTMVQNADTMQYRQVIKIVNTSNRIPIVGTHLSVEDGIKVDTRYLENKGTVLIVDKDGNPAKERNTFPVNDEDTQYTFYIIDNIGNIRRYKANYGSAGKPSLVGFNKKNTFYVMYDENGYEISSIPIGEKITANNWYNYDEQKWANIVVRNNENEAYYVWIPRYVYKINDDGSETVDAKIVDLDNVWTDPENATRRIDYTNSAEYKLPEAFTWEDPDNPNSVIQLTGYWISKYKLTTSTSTNVPIYGLGGSILVEKLVNQYGSNYTYEMYLINSEGKRIVKNEETGEYEEGDTPIILNDNLDADGNYKFTKLPAGEYSVSIILKDSDNHQVNGLLKQITVLEKVSENPPDLSKYNKNLTYYVQNKALGEVSNIPIGTEIKPSEWYDYDEDKKATVVVRDCGVETYYEWIPRYQYENGNKSHIMYIPTSQTQADDGYTIPAEFTGENEDGYWQVKGKPYENRLLATVTAGNSQIKISNIIKSSGEILYNIYLIQDGKVKESTTNVESVQHIFNKVESGRYGVLIEQINTLTGTVSGFAKEVILFDKLDLPDVTQFKKNNAFYVTYDQDGNEDSSKPIGEDIPENWYDYTEQKWANIVVRNNENEAYYVWIPRYEYKTVPTNESIDAIIIPTSQITADEGYQIPEAFTWEDPTDPDKLIQLPGYWISKYKLIDSTSTNVPIYGLGGTILVEKLIKQYGDNYTYEMYLINENGERIVKNSSGEYEQGNTPIILNDKVDADGNYKFTKLPAGEYTVNIIVKDSNGQHVKGLLKQVTVLEKVQENPPDLTKLNKNLTYYVQNNLLGETSNIPIGTKLEPSKWYDYDEDKKATVVVRDCGVETYYEWIPRYQHENGNKSHIMYIPTTKTIADDGYIIPTEFAGDNAAGYWKEREKEPYKNRLLATVTVGSGQIKISNIIANDASAIYYNIYLIQNGEVKQSKSSITNTSTAFSGVASGRYGVLIEQINTLTGTLSGFAKEVILFDKLDLPDLTGFKVDSTYIVTYDDTGTENATQTLRSVLKAGANIGTDDTLISGEVDMSQINGVWYDYTEQKWANIVVRNNGKEAYFVWIPRYEYKTVPTNESVDAIIIPKSQETADEGYQIPEAFTWEDPSDSSKLIQLPGYWISKYKLTT